MAGNPDDGVLSLQDGLFLPEHLPHPPFHLVAQHSMPQPFAHSRPQLDFLEPLMGLDPIGLGIFLSGNILFQSPAPAL